MVVGRVQPAPIASDLHLKVLVRNWMQVAVNAIGNDQCTLCVARQSSEYVTVLRELTVIRGMCEFKCGDFCSSRARATLAPRRPWSTVAHADACAQTGILRLLRQKSSHAVELCCISGERRAALEAKCRREAVWRSIAVCVIM